MDSSSTAERNDTAALTRSFSALSHPVRRGILQTIYHSTTRDQEEVDWEELLTEPAERATVEMYHHHLPKLEDVGYVECHEDDETVSRGPRFDEISAIITLFEDNQEKLPVEWPEAD